MISTQLDGCFFWQIDHWFHLPFITQSFIPTIWLVGLWISHTSLQLPIHPPMRSKNDDWCLPFRSSQGRWPSRSLSKDNDALKKTTKSRKVSSTPESHSALIIRSISWFVMQYIVSQLGTSFPWGSKWNYIMAPDCFSVDRDWRNDHHLPREYSAITLYSYYVSTALHLYSHSKCHSSAMSIPSSIPLWYIIAG